MIKIPHKRKPAPVYLKRLHKKKLPSVFESAPSPVSEENNRQAIIAEPRKAVPFYDPANNNDMKALAEASGIEMLGNIQERAEWPVLVYRSNAVYGFGLVAKRDIKKNAVILPYLGEKYTLKGDEVLSLKQQAYAYIYSGVNTYIFAHTKGSVAVFANHNFSMANMYCENVEGTLMFRAQDDISKGSALLLDYGTEYTFENPPVYLNPFENGKAPAENIQQNLPLYDEKPYKLKPALRMLFKISFPANAFIGPKICSPTFSKTHVKSTQFKQSVNLPIYLVNVTDHIIVLDKQPNISTLMMACVEKNILLIKQLVSHGADVFAEAMNSISVLNIATYMISTSRYSEELENAYLLILKAIHKKYTNTHEEEQLEEKFVSYIHSHVHTADALNLIVRKFAKYSFKTLEVENTEAEAPQQKPKATTETVKKRKRPNINPLVTTQDLSFNSAALVLMTLSRNSLDECPRETEPLNPPKLPHPYNNQENEAPMSHSNFFACLGTISDPKKKTMYLSAFEIKQLHLVDTETVLVPTDAKVKPKLYWNCYRYFVQKEDGNEHEVWTYKAFKERKNATAKENPASTPLNDSCLNPGYNRADGSVPTMKRYASSEKIAERALASGSFFLQKITPPFSSAPLPKDANAKQTELNG